MGVVGGGGGRARGATRLGVNSHFVFPLTVRV